ncbi:Arabinogalactan endo-beta-1,4-galactanase [Flavobacterium sp. 9AF]|uniref:glycoside hydrolase family 53 protein n=1 Tax=Flavobacterium sp. 9AF TaxID=2653142 RepID=UPI0012EFA33A|nr:glycosyl hydrolase 53 family protein [Flavobacterium sp. 9AF]VXB88024.1 Arabinogalactan endo-beta-1,4-galactanase [Flavobacterium sp. 9AF]
MKILKFILIFAFFFYSCSKNELGNDPKIEENNLQIKGADISFLPEIRQTNIVLKNRNNQIEDPLHTLKAEGVNTIRLRLWKNPSTNNSSFETVKQLSEEAKSLGLKVLLTVHYSDTWADPANQIKPSLWNSLSISNLKDSVYNYTKKIVNEINPEYLQIGNEINNGLLWPEGNVNNLPQMLELLQSGINAVRETNVSTKIILHFAGHANANWFFSQVNSLNYDIIGISYYPKWHGKDLNALQENLITLSTTFNKPIFIAETSYGFTTSYNDWTNNIMYDQNDYLPQFSISSDGQKEYMTEIKNIINHVPKGIGFCYWGGEWISYKGPQSTNGSTWENQAMWDFTNKALPVMQIFN